MSQRARPPVVAMTCSVVNARSLMVPRMRRSAVLATATCQGIEFAERIDGQVFGLQRGLDRRDDGRADRAQAGGSDVRHEHREQGADVGHQQAFAPVDPDQVGIPVLLAGFADGRLRHPQQRQHLGGASQHHKS